MSQILKINSIDNKIYYINVKDLLKLDNFFIKNLIEDTYDPEEKEVIIDISEEYNIIKNIIDTLRYRNLIYDSETNLKLMKNVCDKWCIPLWVTEAIVNELGNYKINCIIKGINAIRIQFHKCKICNIGFKLDTNTNTSCKTHKCSICMANTDKYACCGKSEGCKIGYHVPEINNLENIHLINCLKKLL